MDIPPPSGPAESGVSFPLESRATIRAGTRRHTTKSRHRLQRLACPVATRPPPHVPPPTTTTSVDTRVTSDGETKKKRGRIPASSLCPRKAPEKSTPPREKRLKCTRAGWNGRTTSAWRKPSKVCTHLQRAERAKNVKIPFIFVISKKTTRGKSLLFASVLPFPSRISFLVLQFAYNATRHLRRVEGITEVYNYIA